MDPLLGIIFADQWEARAKERIKAAKVPAARAVWAEAFELAGSAVEFALKCRIMRESGLNLWPERRDRPYLYVHDLTTLARFAGLEATLLDQIALGTELGKAWLVAKDWSVEVR